MTEPKVGQWWRTRGGKIGKVIANVSDDVKGTGFPLVVVDSDGDIYVVDENGYYHDSENKNHLDLVAHLPDCTGFDWVEPVYPQYFIAKGAPPESPAKPATKRVRLAMSVSSSVTRNVYRFPFLRCDCAKLPDNDIPVLFDADGPYIEVPE